MLCWLQVSCRRTTLAKLIIRSLKEGWTGTSHRAVTNSLREYLCIIRVHPVASPKPIWLGQSRLLEYGSALFADREDKVRIGSTSTAFLTVLLLFSVWDVLPFFFCGNDALEPLAPEPLSVHQRAAVYRLFRAQVADSPRPQARLAAGGSWRTFRRAGAGGPETRIDVRGLA